MVVNRLDGLPTSSAFSLSKVPSEEGPIYSGTRSQGTFLMRSRYYWRSHSYFLMGVVMRFLSSCSDIFCEDVFGLEDVCVRRSVLFYDALL